ncbi:MAG TPA: protease inhibitor I42 family protein [Mucilaginibacter sp.]|jgi:predicted secreted protein|nr:protease inhibitor I42 family protein [Mucilaginibacter sp.]
MRHNLNLPILCIAACLTFGACKKESQAIITNKPNADVALFRDGSGSVITLTKGQTVSITLGNPIDGNYYFDPVIYNADILSLNGHVYAPPVPDADGKILYGSGGTDTWTFTAIATGGANIKITASRPHGTETSEMFNGTVVVK